MRIALVSPYSWSHPGGVTRHIEALAAELTAAGHEPRVIAPFDGAPDEDPAPDPVDEDDVDDDAVPVLDSAFASVALRRRCRGRRARRRR